MAMRMEKGTGMKLWTGTAINGGMERERERIAMHMTGRSAEESQASASIWNFRKASGDGFLGIKIMSRVIDAWLKAHGSNKNSK